MLGISFDLPAQNKTFQQEKSFPFDLLSDPDKSIGTIYEVLRDPGDKFADYPQRISYLIDPDGMIVEFKVLIRPLQAVNAVHMQMKAMLERMASG